MKLSNIISYAIQAHADTNHLYDGKPYAVHLALVATIAHQHIDLIPEPSRDEVIAACWLHDTIEDCRVTYNDIYKIAGEYVADIVYALTKEKGRNRKERANAAYYAGIRNTRRATYVKLCDRIANVTYSKENGSRMFEVYKKEHIDFLLALNPSELYQPLIDALDDLFVMELP